LTYTNIDIETLIRITRLAGQEIMKVYQKDFAVEYKDDRSPVTEADRRSNEIIIHELNRYYPDGHIITEESSQTPYEQRKDWLSFWLVDPLDGTKEFIKKNGEFTVNIALIEAGFPTFGMVYAPVTDVLYYGIKGQGSFKIAKAQTIRIHNDISYVNKETVKVVASRSHMNEKTRAFITGLEDKGKKIELLSVGSSLKTCLVAEGAADVYPRFGPTMEWDTGAAHAVALYAGRNVLDIETMQPLVYNKTNLLNPAFIVQ
jgi:3'(2'), 5'-bisphosphate nucleotidase